MSTSYFNHAHDLRIQSLTINHQMEAASKPFEHLHRNVAADALHDSDERCNAPMCHQETKIAVQKEIMSWIAHGDDDAEPKKILWLTGPAGAGKTAIAGSIAEVCDEGGLLAGSFFVSSFAGSESRRTKRHLISTLAYCLLQHRSLHPLRGPMLSAVESDLSIFRKTMSGQCKALILKPLRAVWPQLDLSSIPKVIVVDGLDEVEAPNSRELEPHDARLANEAEQREILSVLLQMVRDSHFPFRILLVSRPEPIIRDCLTHTARDVVMELFLDDKYAPDSDIALFLDAKFTDIRRRYRLPTSWPGEKARRALVSDASGQFVYVATVVRFLETAKGHPQARLGYLLPPERGGSWVNGMVLSPLDMLYTRILKSSPDLLASARWIGMINLFGTTPAFFLRQFLQDHQGEIDYLLENLASLVSIPSIEDVFSPFALYHASLMDFLFDFERCGQELYEACHLGGLREVLARRCAHVLSAKSTAIPLSDQNRLIFLRDFLRPKILWILHSPEDGSGAYEAALAACDVLWWVQTVDATFFDSPRAAAACIGSLFTTIHKGSLPGDWAEWYKKELEDGVLPSDIMRPDISRITVELGIDLEDMVILSAGVQPLRLV